MLNHLNLIHKDSLIKIAQLKISRTISRITNFVTKHCGDDLEKVQADVEFFTTSSKVKMADSTTKFKVPYSQYKYYFACIYLIVYAVLVILLYFVFSFDLSIYKNMSMISNKKSNVLMKLSKIHQLSVFEAVQNFVNSTYQVPNNFESLFTDTLTNTSFDAFTQQANNFGFSNDIEKFLNQESSMNICMLDEMLEYKLIEAKCKEVEGQIINSSSYLNEFAIKEFIDQLRERHDTVTDSEFLRRKLKESESVSGNLSYYLSPQTLLTSIKSLMVNFRQLSTAGMGTKIFMTPFITTLQWSMVQISQSLLFLSHYHDLFVVSLLD
jgi:hypothetical protein